MRPTQYDIPMSEGSLDPMQQELLERLEAEGGEIVFRWEASASEYASHGLSVGGDGDRNWTVTCLNMDCRWSTYGHEPTNPGEWHAQHIDHWKRICALREGDS